MVMGLAGEVATLRPWTITLVGSAGGQVESPLARLSTLWPAPVARVSALQTVPQPADAAALIAASRAALVSLDLTRDLSALGARLESADTGIMAVTHFVVYGHEDDAEVRSAVAGLPPVDKVILVCLAEDASTLASPPPGAALLVATSTNSTGYHVDSQALSAAVALVLFVAPFPAVRPLIQELKGTMVIGAAGVVGPAGEWLRPIAAGLAGRLLALQAEPSPLADQRSSPTPFPVETLARTTATGALLVELFDPATIEAPRSEALPFLPAMEDGRISIVFREDQFLLELAEGDEAHWVPLIRSYERSLIGIGVPAWAAKVRLARERLTQQLPARIRGLLEPLQAREPHGPWWTERASDGVREACGSTVTTQSRRVDGVQEALRRLASRVAAVPNPAALALRTLLVAIPAAVFVFPVVDSLYDDGRGLWLSWLAAVAVLAGAAVTSATWFGRQRRQMLRARREAVRAVGDAAAALIAQEAVAALDAVRDVLRREAAEWSERGAESRTRLREAASTASAASEAEPATLRALIPPSEVFAIVSKLALDLAPWLESAARAGVLDTAALQEDAVTQWCFPLVRAKVASGLDTQEAWAAVSLETLTLLAAPLAPTRGHAGSTWSVQPASALWKSGPSAQSVVIDASLCAVVRLAPMQGSTVG